MAQINEITSLVKISVPPSSWRILQSIDKTYSLEYRYTENDEYGIIVNQANKQKNYKTEKSLFKDIARVHQNKLLIQAVIYFEPTQIG